MGLIGRLDGHIFGDEDKGKRNITMDDIAKCKTGNFAMRFIGLVQTAVKKRELVTDSTVAKFMEEHFNHLDEISEKFADAVTKHESAKEEFHEINKEWKKDREMAKNLTKVFCRAAGTLNPNNQVQEHPGVQALSVLGALNQYDPQDLLRAAAYEKTAGSQEKDDIKGHFVDFIKQNGIEIHSEKDLNASYSQFKILQIKNAQDFKNYAQDRSLSEYHDAENDLLEQGRPNIAKFQEMSIQGLLQANAIASSHIHLRNKIKEISLSSHVAAKRAGLEALYLNPGVAPILQEIANKTHMPEAEFMRDYLALKKLSGEAKEIKIKEMMTLYIDPSASLEINTTAVIAKKLLGKHDSIEDFEPSYHHIQDQFINNALQRSETIEGIIDQWKRAFTL